MQIPSVGRVVHYTSYGTPGGEYGQECRAAIITAVPGADSGLDRTSVDLCVLNPEGMYFNQNVHLDTASSLASAVGGTWHWPELVS